MARPKSGKPEPALGRYLRTTQGPWASLLIVLPLMATYELASRGYLGVTPAGPADQLVAFSLIRQGFDALGATGALLPSLTLITCLIGWHLARQDGWGVRPGYFIGMIAEGALLSLPLVGAAALMTHWVPCATLPEGTVARLAVLALGAAVYEELLFRLIVFVLLHIVLVDVLGTGRRIGDILTIIVSSALFAAYHYLGSEAFGWPSFVFRTGAGMFLGVIFLTRGFGVTAVCHAAYDMIWLAVFCHDADV
jgi:membrane protease YdiL (CAAX protease family)